MKSEYFTLKQSRSQQGTKVQTREALFVPSAPTSPYLVDQIPRGTIGTVAGAVKAFSASFGQPMAVYRLEVQFEGGAVGWFDKKQYEKSLAEVQPNEQNQRQGGQQ